MPLLRTQAESNSALTTVLTREQTDKRDSSEAIWEGSPRKAKKKRGACIAGVLRTQLLSWHWIIPKGFTLSSSWSLHFFTFWTEIGVHTHQRPEASQRASCCGGWWYSFWARMGFSRQCPSEWNINFWAQRDEDGGRQALWSVGIHHLQYETNLSQPSPCPEHFITVGPSCLHQTETLKRAVNLSRAMWEMWLPQDAGAFGGLKHLSWRLISLRCQGFSAEFWSKA